MNFIDSIIAYFVSITTITTGIVWTGKILFTSWVNKKVDIDKIEMQHRFNIELEKLRIEKSRIEEENKIVFSELHSKRAAIIVDIYGKIFETVVAAEESFRLMENSGMPSRKDRFKKLTESFNEFVLSFGKNKIFFSEKTAEVISEFIKEIKGGIINFDIFVMSDDSDRWNADKSREWKNAWDLITKDRVPEMIRQIEREFREILGV